MKNRQEYKKTLKRRRNKFIQRAILVIFLILSASALYLLFNNHLDLNSNQTSATSTTQTTNDSSSSSSTSPSEENDITWEKQDETVQVPILMYHAIHVMDPSESASANLIVNPDVFEEQLKAMQDAGYYTLTAEEVYKILTENVLPNGNKNVVWLTFDDSNEDFYTIAYPILQKYNMKATNNVITGFVENNQTGFLTLDQILEMQANGMSFQSHTVNHPDLSASSYDTQYSELQTSKNYLDTKLNQDTIAIAYPSGRYSDETTSILQDLGYKLAVTTNPGLASLDDGLLTLDRIRIYPTTTGQDLISEMAY